MDKKFIRKCQLCDMEGEVGGSIIGPIAGGPVAYWCKHCKKIVERYHMKRKVFENYMRKRGLKV